MHASSATQHAWTCIDCCPPAPAACLLNVCVGGGLERSGPPTHCSSSGVGRGVRCCDTFPRHPGAPQHLHAQTQNPTRARAHTPTSPPTHTYPALRTLPALRCCLPAADANILVNICRLAAQRYLFAYQEPMPVEQLVRSVCDTKQASGQQGRRLGGRAGFRVLGSTARALASVTPSRSPGPRRG